MLDIWSVQTGHDLGQFEENQSVSLSLPIKPNATGSFKLISGKIPPGLRLKDSSIVGTPLEVARSTEFEFCIRASKNNQIDDRTFRITINGSDEPQVITDPGVLPVGPNQTYFILDSTPVDFQLEALDYDTAAGQVLRFFISSGDGELPPGLKLTRSGRIVGFVEPLIAVPYANRNGGYDRQKYNSIAYDYGIKSDNGFDSFNFDSITYDYSAPFRGLKKLNRNFEFVVTISDGDTFKKAKYRIFVVGEDYLRADNSIMKVGTNTFLASNSSLKKPIWQTPPNLGYIRTNNYHIVKLDIYETIDIGRVQYNLKERNPDNSISRLPPGMSLDIVHGEIYGLIPYQSEITDTYHFTVTATRFGEENEIAPVDRTFTLTVLGEVDSNMSWISDSDLGIINANYISTLKITATSSLSNALITYRVISGQLPPGLTLNKDGEIIGKINQYSTEESPGLTTFYDEVGTPGASNYVRYNNQTFDNGETDIDKTYKFIIRASDQTNYSAIDREFTLKIETPNDKLYSNLYVTTYMNIDKREKFRQFINSESVFEQSNIYRPYDPNFGIRNDLRVLIYAGIETINASEYISMIGLNHKKKRLAFGDVKLALAKNIGTNDLVYEVIYVEMIDLLDKKDQHLPLKINKMSKANRSITGDMSNYTWKTQDKDFYITRREPFSPRPFENITIDRTNLQVSDYRTRNRYPSTVYNWRRRIRHYQHPNSTGISSELKYLPLWMRSFQEDREELGFVLALPLCYCMPGKGEEILLNIKNYQSEYNFDFKDLDYTIDRYVIDSVENYGYDKYLVFKEHEATL